MENLPRVTGIQFVGFVILLMPLTGCGENVYMIREEQVRVRPGLRLVSLEVGEQNDRGEPVVFVSGAACDDQEWGLHQSALVNAGYRAISYSRHYDNPRDTDPSLFPKSVQTLADDLRHFIDGMELSEVHLVGHSFAAYAALLYALDHPDRVRSLTITEPPILPWLDEASDDQAFLVERLKPRVHAELIEPLREAFDSGDDARAVDTLLDFFVFGGNSSRGVWPPIAMRCRGSRVELKALLTSEQCYPPINKSRIRGFDVPTLVLSGELATEFGGFIDRELDALLPPETHDRVFIERAGHFIWTDNSRACEAALLEFLDSQ